MLAKRLRAASRHVSQAVRKAAQPRWVVKPLRLEPGDPVGADPADDDCEEVESLQNKPGDMEVGITKERKDEPGAKDEQTTSTTVEWKLWGWSAGLGMAWRSDGTGWRAKTEYTGNIFEGDEASIGDFVLADFGDGQRYEISDLSVGDWRMLQTARKKAISARISSRPPLWERIADSGARLSIKVRKDRQSLVSLCKDGRQICQVPEAAFGDTASAVTFLEALCGLCHLRLGRVDTELANKP